jgi:predicted nuclease with TOPRIM domain
MGPEIGYTEIGAAVSGIAASAYVGVLGFRRLVKSWMSEGVHIQRSKAEMDIIEHLRSEYEQMGEHNAELMKAMRTLQTEILSLHQSISTLRLENVNLKEEVQNLHSVIDQLRSLKGLQNG